MFALLGFNVALALTSFLAPVSPSLNSKAYCVTVVSWKYVIFFLVLHRLPKNNLPLVS
jgi:hypothetical protein